MGSTCAGSEATPRLDEIYQATLDAKDAELTASKHKIIELESKLAQQLSIAILINAHSASRRVLVLSQTSVGASSFYHKPPFAGGVKADGTFGTALLDTGMKFGKEVR